MSLQDIVAKVMSVGQTAPLHRFRVTITCPSLRLRETVVVEAADAGEAQPAAIAVYGLPLNGELIDFAVCDLGAAVSEPAQPVDRAAQTGRAAARPSLGGSAR